MMGEARVARFLSEPISTCIDCDSASGRPKVVRSAQADFLSGMIGGCSPGLLAQRSRFSMTFSWLGRRGFGAFGSSESLRGSLMSSGMAVLQERSMRLGDRRIKD
jgi:hypothetical protein